MLIVSRSNSKIEKGRGGEGKMHIVDPLNEIPEVGGKSPHKKEAAAEGEKAKPKKVDQAAAQKADGPAAKVEDAKPAQQKAG